MPREQPRGTDDTLFSRHLIFCVRACVNEFFIVPLSTRRGTAVSLIVRAANCQIHLAATRRCCVFVAAAPWYRYLFYRRPPSRQVSQCPWLLDADENVPNPTQHLCFKSPSKKSLTGRCQSKLQTILPVFLCANIFFFHTCWNVFLVYFKINLPFYTLIFFHGCLFCTVLRLLRI